jgi:hypothetical protein
MFRFTLREMLLTAALVAVCSGWAADRWLRNPERFPLGLDGYCPVTLAQSSRWKRGQPQYHAVHDGRRYLLAGAIELQVFEGDPQRYAPIRGGEDVVRMIDNQKLADGKREHGVFAADGIYLFDSEETLAKFVANPAKYSAAALTTSSVATSK